MGMRTFDNKINDALGITQSITQEILDPKPIIPRPPETFDDADADYKYSRENFYNLVERGQDAITGILEFS